MKSTVVKPEATGKLELPCIMEAVYDDYIKDAYDRPYIKDAYDRPYIKDAYDRPSLVVLFDTETSGTVLISHNTAVKVGAYESHFVSCYDPQNWKPFTGQIILEN